MSFQEGYEDIDDDDEGPGCLSTSRTNENALSQSEKSMIWHIDWLVP